MLLIRVIASPAACLEQVSQWEAWWRAEQREAIKLIWEVAGDGVDHIWKRACLAVATKSSLFLNSVPEPIQVDPLTMEAYS